jgi:thiamine pyrophosphate-dependent acetolactate synthase large subunit-like protein
MGEAYHDSIPMVVVSSQIPVGLLERRSGYLHELRESTRMSASVTKASYRVERLDELEAVMAAAFATCSSGRPGPVHVELPVDLLRSAADLRGAEEIEGLDAAAAMLNRARRVAVIAGGGALDAAVELKALTERLSAPVVTTAAGKGALDERHPLSLGGRLHLPAVKEFLRRMDAVLIVGSQLSTTDTWQEEPLDLPPAVAAINLDPGDFDRNIRCRAGLRGNADRLLSLLLNDVTARELPEMRREVERVRSRCDGEVAAVIEAGAQFERMYTLLRSLRRALPEDGALFTDMTGPAYAALSEWPAYRPRSFFHPVGFGTLGYALPAAIGAAAERLAGGCCVLTGDGGLQFTLQELAVARDLSLPLPIVVWNDDGYGEIRKSEERRHPGRRIAVDHPAPQLRQLAAAYGMEYCRIEKAEEIEAAAARVLAGAGPALLEVPACEKGGLQ